MFFFLSSMFLYRSFLVAFAQGILALVELILQRVYLILPLFQLFFLRLGLGIQLGGGFLAVFRADDRTLNVDDRNLAGGLRLREESRGQKRGPARRIACFSQ